MKTTTNTKNPFVKPFDPVAAVTARYGPPYKLRKDAEGNITGVSALVHGHWAARFAELHTVLHDPAEKQFYKYNGESGLFVATPADMIKRAIQDMILDDAAVPGAPPGIREACTDNALNSILGMTRARIAEQGAFENKPMAIHARNTMLELTASGFVPVPFDPRFKSRNQIPVDYDPAAACPRFLNELVRPVLTEENILLVQKMFGQALMGKNLCQRMLLFCGIGELGKSCLANVLRAIIGRVNCIQLRPSLLETRFETGRLLGKTFAYGSDVPPEFLNSDGASVIKSLVGNDPLDAEGKGINGALPTQGQLNCLFTFNAEPLVKLKGDVGAWRRRLIRINFEGKGIPKKIPLFDELLVREEGSGILNWGLDGARLLLADIERDGDIFRTPAQRAIIDSLLGQSDSLRLFVAERIVPDDGSDVTSEEAVRAYCEFCIDRGWTPMPERTVEKQLPNVILAIHHRAKSHDLRRDGRDKRGWRGLRIVDSSARTDAQQGEFQPVIDPEIDPWMA